MNESKFVLDSNVVIDFVKGALGDGPLMRLPVNGKLYVSVITRIESFAFQNLSPDEDRQIRLLLKILKVVPLTKKVEKNTILIRASTKRKLPDSIIAATAVSLGATLISRDPHMLKLDWPGLPVISSI
ncbi:MAG: type II toxin-antitoxin system VapC family toxin [Treponema sp.]|jgi:predicted nucleic acid-binding protein|nr:type II toxin-antitoxin system VapC family toxin [Treponema sp.]